MSNDLEEDELIRRIRRIYAALDDIEESDLSSGIDAWDLPGSRGIVLDASMGLSPEDLENRVMLLVHNIATLPDLMRRWAKRSKANPELVNDLEGSSRALAIMRDLHNRDKHGPERRGGISGLGPELRAVHRGLRIASKGSVTTAFLRPTGVEVSGGDAKYVITGDVVDASGSGLGDFRVLAGEAVEALEICASRLGIKANGS